ncbi:hypothetical protein ACP0HM_33160 [Escherichia coli]
MIDSQSASKLIPAAVEGGLHQIETASGAVLKARSIIVATGAKMAQHERSGRRSVSHQRRDLLPALRRPAV